MREYLSLFNFPPYVPPDGECTHCGQPSNDLQPVSVAGYEVVVDEKLCPTCRNALARADDFLAL